MQWNEQPLCQKRSLHTVGLRRVTRLEFHAIDGVDDWGLVVRSGERDTIPYPYRYAGGPVVNGGGPWPIQF